jgi:hypothetical protein
MPLPLAYVFWHKPHGGILQRDYEKRLLTFQRSLKAHPPDGLVDALSFGVDVLPWLRRRSLAYEDWYLVEDFRSLGALNEAAVSADNRRPHDKAAQHSVAVAGGVYRRRSGSLRLQDARFEAWIRKPAAASYEEFLESLSKSAGARKTDLWQRQMVLGPAPEFCVHSESPLKLPKGLEAATVSLRLVAERG